MRLGRKGAPEMDKPLVWGGKGPLQIGGGGAEGWSMQRPAGTSGNQFSVQGCCPGAEYKEVKG